MPLNLNDFNCTDPTAPVYDEKHEVWGVPGELLIAAKCETKTCDFFHVGIKMVTLRASGTWKPQIVEIAAVGEEILFDFLQQNARFRRNLEKKT